MFFRKLRFFFGAVTCITPRSSILSRVSHSVLSHLTSIIYLLMWEFAHETLLMQMLTKSAEWYSSLHPDAGYTDTSVSMQGDVIELILERCRLTGYAIEPSVCKDRLQTSQAFKPLCERINTLLRVISDGEDVKCDDLPAPSVFVAEIRLRLGG